MTHNSGGLQCAYIPGVKRPDAMFRQTLRGAEKIVKEKIMYTAKEKERNSRSRSFERDLVMRLTSSNKNWKKMTKERLGRS